MAKKRKAGRKKSTSNKNKYIAVLVTVVMAIGALFFVLDSGGGASATESVQQQKITPQDYQSTYVNRESDHILLDVRTPDEFSSGHIAGAVNIPVQELQQRLREVPADKDIVIYCRSGNRSAQASSILVENGYSDVYDMGGIIAWQQAGYPIE